MAHIVAIHKRYASFCLDREILEKADIKAKKLGLTRTDFVLMLLREATKDVVLPKSVIQRIEIAKKEALKARGRLYVGRR